VLAAHWPDVANLGDMTKIAAAVRAGEVEAPDVLVGGTPARHSVLPACVMGSLMHAGS
jgi:DNA (cytosine-5)-methyltransferase 1